MRVPIAVVIVVATLASCNSGRSTNDPEGSLGGVVYQSANEPPLLLEHGPLMLTDVMIEGRAGKVFTANDVQCKERDQDELFYWNVPEYKPTEIQSHHAMRLFVPAGKTLCLQTFAGQNKLVWAASRVHSNKR